jgi:hypothetical protein
MSVNELYLKPNDFVLFESSPDENFILRVLDAQPIVLGYHLQQQISNFAPLNIYLAPAGNGLNSYIVDKIEFPMQEYTNVTNIFDSSVIKTEGTNIMLQVFMGIAPSPLRIFRYYPSLDAIGNLVDGTKVHWGGREAEYNLGYVDGFVSPKNDPTIDSEFFFPPVSSMLFTVVNPVAVPAVPSIKFYINQMVLEPVSSVALAQKILDRVVPAKRATAGAFNKGVSLTDSDGKLFGVSPVPLDATVQELQKAGYGVR